MAFESSAEEAEAKLDALLAEPLRQAFEQGSFAPAEDADCSYCDFKAACDASAIKARVKAQRGGA
jgi:sulfatase maturation enzyme AslB (radical SAM superfamily)